MKRFVSQTLVLGAAVFLSANVGNVSLAATPVYTSGTVTTTTTVTQKAGQAAAQKAGQAAAQKAGQAAAQKAGQKA